MKNKIVICVIFLLIGMILGVAIKKTSNPLFSWGNKEVDIKIDSYK